MNEPTEGQWLEGVYPYAQQEREQELRHVVAGMLSTTEYTPAEMYPGNMLPLADRVIRYVQQFGHWDQQGNAEKDPEDTDGPS